MRACLPIVVIFMCTAVSKAAEPPLVEQYLHDGRLAHGELALEAALAANPKDDQLRFGLGVLRFMRAVERLGQSLYEYGANTEDNNRMFLRLPVPKNPDPAPITYMAFRRILEDFSRDLASAETALAGISDDTVTLPLRLAAIRFDLTNDGKPDQTFLAIIQKISQQAEYQFLASNPEFLVKFDRGDAAWLRAYCHLFMGFIEGYLAFDTQAAFEDFVAPHFAKARMIEPKADINSLLIREPLRLERFRKHILQVAVLNREVWKHIRAETDNDHEWLPNARQSSVLRLPVTDELIDTWLEMMAEVEELFEGRCTLPQVAMLGRDGKGLNLKKFLQHPPEALMKEGALLPKLDDALFTEGRDVDLNKFLRAFQLMNTMGFLYGAWFN